MEFPREVSLWATSSVYKTHNDHWKQKECICRSYFTLSLKCTLAQHVGVCNTGMTGDWMREKIHSSVRCVLLENFLSALTMQAEKIGLPVVCEAAPKPRRGKGMAVHELRRIGIGSKSRHKACTSHRDFTRIDRENVTIWDVHWPQHPSAGQSLLSHLHTTSTAFKKLGLL